MTVLKKPLNQGIITHLLASVAVLVLCYQYIMYHMQVHLLQLIMQGTVLSLQPMIRFAKT